MAPVLCCYTSGDPLEDGRFHLHSSQAAGLASVREHAPQAEMVDVTGDDFAYWRELTARWDCAGDLVVIEHDIEIGPGTVASLEECPEPWCTFAYDIFGCKTVSNALGCTKLSAALRLAVPPGAVEMLFSRCPHCHGRGCWWHLDDRLAAALEAAGFSPHVHGEVGHLHDYGAPGTIPLCEGIMSVFSWEAGQEAVQVYVAVPRALLGPGRPGRSIRVFVAFAGSARAPVGLHVLAVGADRRVARVPRPRAVRAVHQRAEHAQLLLLARAACGRRAVAGRPRRRLVEQPGRVARVRGGHHRAHLVEAGAVTEISGYATNTAMAAGDLVLHVDVSDTSMAGTGTDKKATVSTLGKAVTGWQDLVRDFGADPTGSSSVATALSTMASAAVSAQPATVGLTVPPGQYLMTAHQDLPWNLVVKGAGAAGGDVTDQFTGSVFKLSGSFSGSTGYVFGFKDNADHSNANGCMVSDIYVDGSAYTSLAVDGFRLTGPVMCTFRDIRIAQMSGWAIGTAEDTSSAEIGPFGQTWRNVTADSCATVSGGGFQLIWCEDSVFTECYSIGNGGPGFYISDCDNAKFTACNSEWNSNYGYYLTGDWQWATGGCQFTGCSTDANGQYGMYVDATWTTGGGAGTGPGIIMVNGAHFRRDGQVTSTPSAGIALGATTLPVIVTGFSTMPSIGDGGGGSMNPEYGLYFTQSSYAQPVVFSGGLAWGLTGAIEHGAGGGGSAGSGFPTGVTNTAVALAHGNNYSPTYGSLQGGGGPVLAPLLRAPLRAEHVVGPFLPLDVDLPRVLAGRRDAVQALAHPGLAVHQGGDDGRPHDGGRDCLRQRRRTQRAQGNRPVQAAAHALQADEDEQERCAAHPCLDRVRAEEREGLLRPPGAQQHGHAYHDRH